ncbi:MAG TPA: TRAP transporter small permease [Burkholderiales bacterium]|nr:TRAP transporter small permease [Burkholderiales bacterium]
MKKVFAWVDRGVEYGVAAIFAAMCAVGLLQVFNRFVLNKSLSWSEEFQIYCHVWIVFLAIPIAYRHGAHLSVDSLRKLFPRKLGVVFDTFIELLWIWFAVALTWLSWKVSEVAKLQSSPGLEMPMSYVYYGMVVGGAYLLLVVLRRIFLKEKPLQQPLPQ